MANEAEVTIRLTAKDDASRVLNNTTNNMGKMSDQVRRFGAAMGAAMTAAGVAALKLAADARVMNAQLAVTAITLETTTEELRALAIETANVTFPLKEVTATFDLLARAGVEGNEAIARAATGFDTMGDAAGIAASMVARDLIPVFKMFDLSLENPLAEMDRFTFLIRETLIDLPDFARVLRTTGRFMDDMGLSADDLIVILKTMQEQFGLVGRAASSELSEKMMKVITSGGDLVEMLGLNVDMMAQYRIELEAATGMTQQFADAANTQFGLLDTMKQKFSEVTLTVGSFLEPLDGLAASMTVLGPLIIAFSVNTTLAAGAARAFGVALRFAMGPVGWIITGITALILVTKALGLTWDVWLDGAKQVWKSIGDTIGGVVDFLTGAFDSFRDAAVSAFEFIGKSILTNMMAPFLLVISLVEKVIEGVQKIPLIGSRIPGLAGIGESIQGIQDFAGRNTFLPTLGDGGIVTRPTVAVVGERGPEAIIPLGRGGAVTAIIPIYLGGREIDRYMVDILAQKATLQGVRSRWT